MTANPTPPILSARQLYKHFGGSVALNSMSLDILPGEIHGLVGENGSGKSTFIKVLSGYHTPDTGEILVNDRPAGLPLTGDVVEGCAFAFVHQDLGLIEEMTVLENFFLSWFAAPDRRTRLRLSALRAKLDKAWDRYGGVERGGFALSADRLVRDLTPIQRALLAIIRAVSAFDHGEDDNASTGILVLDEPTVYLPISDRQRLFDLIASIVDARRGVLFVSHDLDEVRQFCDRVSVLRDGGVVRTLPRAAAERRELIALMSGRDIEVRDGSQRPTRTAGTNSRGTGGRTVAVQGLMGPGVRGVDLHLGSGEIVGLAGVAGSGYIELLDLLYGAASPTGGRLILDGRPRELVGWTPARAVAEGIALVPADRVHRGGVSALSVGENVEMPILRRFFRRGRIERRGLRNVLASLLDRYDVRPPEPKAGFETLSGGNQQKAIFAKWAQISPKLLLLQEPSQGVDVAARERIWLAIEDLAVQGTAVLIACSDHAELAALCSRVILVSDGRTIGELGPTEISKRAITEACYGDARPDIDLDLAETY